MLFLPPSVFAQPSVIETAQQIQSSIVSVQALQAHTEKCGAGVILSSDGLIVTNFHTVREADRLLVRLADQTRTTANILQISPEDDLALIKVDKHLPLIPIVMADSDQLALGDTVLHIGHSFLLDGTISQGRITGLGSSLKAKTLGTHTIAIIKVNLNLYKGDSGGPLLNQQGQFIGMMTAKDITQDRTSYALPVNKIKNILLNYRE